MQNVLGWNSDAMTLLEVGRMPNDNMHNSNSANLFVAVLLASLAMLADI